VKALDKEHPRTPTEETLGAAEGHLDLSDCLSTSVSLLLSLYIEADLIKIIPSTPPETGRERPGLKN